LQWPNRDINTATISRRSADRAAELHPFVGPNKKVKLPDDEEVRLSDWLSRHGRVAWLADPTPWIYEAGLLKSGSPLALNIKGNDHDYVQELILLRKRLSQ
jgi:hypothetical protein